MRKREYEPPLCECKGCYYWRSIGGLNACHYALDANIIRGIPPIECYKHKGTPYKKKGSKNAKVIY